MVLWCIDCYDGWYYVEFTVSLGMWFGIISLSHRYCSKLDSETLMPYRCFVNSLYGVVFSLDTSCWWVFGNVLVDYIASVDCIGMLYVRLLSYTVLWCIGVMFVSTLWVCCMTWYVVWNHLFNPPVVQHVQSLATLIAPYCRWLFWCSTWLGTMLLWLLIDSVCLMSTCLWACVLESCL